MKELSLSFGHFKREDELPLTIIVNGCTYQSQPLVDATKKTYFEMGKQHGMKLGSDNTYSDNEMSNMHDAWFDEGYTKGYEAGYDAGIDHGIEKTLQDDRVKEELERTKQTWYATGKEAGYGDGYEDGKKEATFEKVDQFNKGYEIGKYEGYEAGKRDQFNDYNKLIDESNERNTKLIDEGMKVARKLGYNEGFEEGKSEGYDEGYEAGKKSNGYSADDIKQFKTELDLDQNTAKISIDEHIRKYWYAKGKEEGYDTASIKYFDEYSVKLNDRYKSGYDDGYNDGYEQCKHDGISKINLNTESVEQTELSKEYDKGFTKGFEEGKSEGYEAGYDAGIDHGIEKTLSRIDEARLMGYEQGRSDCREATLQKKLLQEHIMKYGRDEHGVIMECGDDEEDGELIGPEQTEYD
jgi:flagellar biosynthesis/type III secretory pathway protein FliH